MKMKKILFSFFLYLSSIALFAQNYPQIWEARGIGGGGAWFGVSINPQNDNEFCLGTDMTGLYRTDNFGLSYEMAHFEEVRANPLSVVQYTNDPLVRYILSSDPVNGGHFPKKSIDGGITWSNITDPTGDNSAYHLLANPYNTNELIITDYWNLYFSNDGGSTFSLKYTTNSTESAGAGIHVGGAFWDNNNNIYIATTFGIITSTNGGTTFSLSAPTGFGAGEVLLSFAAAKEGTETKFWCVTASAGDIYAGVVPYDFSNQVSKIYTKKSNQSNWTLKNIGVQSADMLYFIRCAVNDTSIAYVGGGNSNPIVLKTSNGGNSWSHIFLSANNQNIATGYCGQNGDFSWGWAELVLTMDVAPNNANKIVIADYGFVHTSTNGGITWQQAYNDAADQNAVSSITPKGSDYHSIGLENTSSWQIFWIDSLNTWTCYSDIRGIRSNDGAYSHNFNYTGQPYNSSYRVVKNIANNTLYLATSSVHDLYESTRLGSALDATANTGEVLYSSNNGATWQTLHNFSDIVAWVATNPNNSNQLYASVVNSVNGNGGVWVSNNINLGASSTWSKLPNPPNTQGRPFNIIVLNDDKVLVSYSARRNPDFTSSSGIFLYDPVSNTWQDKSTSAMRYWTRDVVVDPFDTLQNTWYACVYKSWGTSSGPGGLFKTTNRGTTWTEIGAFEYVGSASINPNNANQMYVCTETEGLWFSENINDTNPTFTQTNYPFHHPQRVFFNPYKEAEVWVTNFGNGLRVGNTDCIAPEPTISGNSSVCANQFNTYQVAAVSGATYNWTVSGGTIQSGQGTNTIEVLWSNGAVGTVQIQQSNP